MLGTINTYSKENFKELVILWIGQRLGMLEGNVREFEVRMVREGVGAEGQSNIGTSQSDCLFPYSACIINPMSAVQC